MDAGGSLGLAHVLGQVEHACDGFRTLEDGYMEPEDDKYADQKIVFETVGKQI